MGNQSLVLKISTQEGLLPATSPGEEKDPPRELQCLSKHQVTAGANPSPTLPPPRFPCIFHMTTSSRQNVNE